MSTVYTFQTFQQAQAAGEQPDFIRRFVQQHCASEPYKIALDADLYDAQKNPGAERFAQAYALMLKLFPAHAGVIRPARAAAAACSPFPRVCGVCEKESRVVLLRMLFCWLQIL